MKKLVLTLVLCLSVVAMYAQEETADPKAKAILQSLGKKTKAYKTIKAEFTMVVYGKDGKPTDNQKGNLTIKGGKYKFDMKNQVVISDSNTMWTYLKDANEVQINNVDHNTDKGSISPATIFTIYEKGFKSHFESEEGNLEVVDLYPKHPEKEKYHTIKLVIDKNKNQITSIKVMLKDGTMMSYTIDNFVTDTAIADSYFKFEAKDYPGVEVTDLRE
ncbi:MAG TPA: outer membrane lipoprotein carrier protein LolA [Bacteroidia bacterium]|nr:outer membrane lipoprotein carrier protein LolA [Bacteroidia bacterium]